MLNNDSIEQCLANLGHLKPIIGNEFHSITTDEMTTFEDCLSCSLPAGFRHFALKYGCCTFVNLVGYKLNPESTIYVSAFYGGDSEPNDTFRLRSVFDLYEGRLPPNMMPIADCAEQGEICLGIRNSELGKVYFWNREDSPIELENSFTDFICNLLVDEEE